MEAEPPKARPEVDRGQGATQPIKVAKSQAVAADPSPSAKSGSSGKTRQLLVVDDEESVRSLVRMMGEFLGYEILEAVNGAEALNQLQKKTGGVEVVLTDVNMPVMDGIELVRALKKMPVPPAIAVMSGRFDPAIRATLQAEGVTVLMGKPFSTDELGLTLSQLQTTTR